MASIDDLQSREVPKTATDLKYSAAQVDGYHARQVDYRFVFGTVSPEVPPTNTQLLGRAVFFERGDYLYGIAYSGAEKAFNQHNEVFARVVSSFAFQN